MEGVILITLERQNRSI